MSKTFKNSIIPKNSVESTIPKLRKTLKERFEIDVPSQCDKFLERCLRQKDGNLEKAARLVQAVHRVILDLENWDAKLDPKCYDDTCYKLPILCPLATRDKLGRRVFVAQPKLWNPDTISFEEMTSAILMMTVVAVTNEEDQKHGYVAIWNMEAFSLQQVWALNPRKLFKIFKWIQGGVMGRVKSLYFVNHPKVIGLMYEGLKSILSEKMKKRIKFHKNLTELQESLDMDLTSLPHMCGGNMEVEECMDKEFMKDLLSSTDFFQDMLNIGFPIK